MRRALQIVVLVAGLVVLVAPAANMVRPWFDEPPIEGALAEVARPTLTLRRVASEEFQKEFTTWFEQRYGLKATATRLDNSIGYYVFDEARPDKHVRVGRNDVLFLDEQAWFHDRRDDPRDGIRAFARAARRTQDVLAARGIALVLLVLPSKPTFYRDAFPDGWALPLGGDRPCDANVYRPFVAALAGEGVRFVDGRRLITERLGAERDLVYSPTGRHLNAPAVCLILDAGFSLVRDALPGAAIPALDCRYQRVTPPTIVEEEFDLLRLLNVFGARAKVPIPAMVAVAETVPRGERLDALVVGSSFAWKVVKEAERNHALGQIHVFYYNKSVADRDVVDGPLTPLPPVGSDAWRALVFGKSLVILPLPEEYLPLHDGDFLLDVLRSAGQDTSDVEAALTPH